ncbi:2-C-methyl-D-erythritol 4-phosphate cytidylyltransferase [Pedobacter sp. UYEF25]
MKNYAIIVAGGSGKRMNTEVPKQFLLLKGLPVLMHTINSFARSKSKPIILLVLNSDLHHYWAELCLTYHFDTPHSVVVGGNERFHSVKNAIDKITEEGFIAVHDGVRPLVSTALIDACFTAAKKFGNAVPAVMANESVRKKIGINSICLNRSEIFMVQTPQVFSSTILKHAYCQEFSETFTDDASVVEKDGVEIFLLEGEIRNIKITYPVDVYLADFFINEIN